MGLILVWRTGQRFHELLNNKQNNMELSDFKDNPKDLIGKYVWITSRYGQEVKKITRVTKTAFGFDDTSDLFSLKSGWLKGGDAWSIVSAKLITEERANELRSIWAKQKRQRHLK